MISTTVAEKKSEFFSGLQAGLTIAIGYFPVAITFGLLAEQTGLTLWETLFMSMFVYAGAAQYISLSFIAAGVGAFEIVLTTFIVNIRHFLMSASLNEKVEKDSLWKKGIYSFGITDETFSVASVRQGTVTTSYMFGLAIISYLSWVINSGIGHAVGVNLPVVLQESMSIALYALFIGLLVPSLKKHRKVVALASFAAVVNSIFVLTNWLSSGWSIVAATISSAFIVEWIWTKWNFEVMKDE
ncbi:AzlC family ABC transporter permease [Bacillus alveayuensis]|jgi:4-azaleucine resistance transporter AzlC|uniref:4-azaleucine resistance transporter AzlC n=1 Tax=Aeribacillus alveayuensis TaxID=279215 RepID=A0ABT9VN05_9BACI|nr:AzlC family ABC transporter permease [Bacillus alveayuensis]MDQ0162352.1 4-azaleucine resistance transporter AzlC [Bacillus alveayuensis]